MKRPVMTALHIARDFGVGLVLFSGATLMLGGEQPNAYARPGAAVVQPHTIIAMGAAPPMLDLSASSYFVPTTTAAHIYEPGHSAFGAHAPNHPLNVTLLALMMAALTAVNLAMVRHLRRAYRRRR